MKPSPCLFPARAVKTTSNYILSDGSGKLVATMMYVSSFAPSYPSLFPLPPPLPPPLPSSLHPSKGSNHLQDRLIQELDSERVSQGSQHKLMDMSKLVNEGQRRSTKVNEGQQSYSIRWRQWRSRIKANRRRLESRWSARVNSWQTEAWTASIKSTGVNRSHWRRWEWEEYQVTKTLKCWKGQGESPRGANW